MQPEPLKKIRTLVVFFIGMLALSGITAFPVYSELHWLKQQGLMRGTGFISTWLGSVYYAVADVQQRYPFCFTGTIGWPLRSLLLPACFMACIKTRYATSLLLAGACFAAWLSFRWLLFAGLYVVYR